MNLLEVLSMYQEFLQNEGRAAANQFLVDVVGDVEGVDGGIPHWHIISCFDDKGHSLSDHVAFEPSQKRTYHFS